LRDYGANVAIIWEQSFWKGTVQEVINYGWGSVLKYTIAKRFTGKSETGIDSVWITPDFVVSNNPDTEIDEQLEVAKKWWQIH
jgi:C-terminal processing protease CtpA/Prc